MIGLYIYLSGVFLIWCAFAYYAFIEREEVRKKDIFAFVLCSFFSYLALIFFLVFAIGYYIDKHDEEVVFNHKRKIK